jgi:hypothetical protein
VKTLEDEQLSNQTGIQEFNHRITELEMKLRRAQAEPHTPFPYSANGIIAPGMSPVRFRELAEADPRLTEETYRILRGFQDRRISFNANEIQNTSWN